MNDHLPPVLAAEDRPTSVEVARAELVSVCQLSGYATRHNGDMVRVKGHLLMAFEASFFFEPGCEGDTWVSFDDKRVKRLSPSGRLRFDDLLEAEHRKLPPGAIGQTDLEIAVVGRLDGTRPGQLRFGHLGRSASELTVFAIESVDLWHQRSAEPRPQSRGRL